MLVRETFAHPSAFSDVMPLEFRRTPLLYIATVLVFGIAASHWWRPASLLVCGTAASVVLAALALRRAPRLALVTTLLTWLLLGWTVGVLHPPGVQGRTLLPYTDGLRREATATVLTVEELAQRREATGEIPLSPLEQAVDQEPDAPQQTRYVANLQLHQVEQLGPDRSTMTNVAGIVRVTLTAGDGSILECGADVRGLLRLYRPREFRDAGVWQYSEWLAEQQVGATGNVVPQHIAVAGHRTAPLPCRFQQMRSWAAGRLRRFTDWQQTQRWLPAALRWNSADAAAWNAMLFGDRGALTRELRADFERTGTFHLFVVSGMHIGLLAGFLLWMGDHLRWSRLLTAVLTGLAAGCFALLTGFGAPVQRALFVTLVFLVAQAMGRERNTLNAVGAAVLAMLLLRPQSLRDAGFQMTVLIALTVAGIAMPLLNRTLSPYARACRQIELVRLDRRLPPHVAQFRVRLRWLAQELSLAFGPLTGHLLLATVRGSAALLCFMVLSIVTELAMALPMAFYFHRYTTFALPANLILMPLVLPIMVCGIVAFLLALIAFPLGMMAAAPAAVLQHGAGWLVRSLAALHGADLRTTGPPTPAALLLAIGIGLSIVLMRLPIRRFGWAATALVCSVGAATVLCARSMPAPHALEVTAIDVGQGDSILLTAPGGKTMLIDAGGTVGPEHGRQREAQAEFDIGEQVVSPYLWHRGIAKLDVLALTHAHMDHLGGMASVLRNFRPRELWLSANVPSDRLHGLLAQAEAQGTTVRFLRGGARQDWQSVHIDVLGPEAGYVPGSAPANDDSLVLRAVYGHASALLAGDAEWASESTMLTNHLLSPVTLLKVGHHGSLTSTSAPFLDALAPKFAVISCGRGNHFGHPRMPILERLQQRQVRTSRTDTMGAIDYMLYADGTVATMVPPANE